MIENHTAAPHGESHGSLASYIVGFILSVVLTIIAFYVVIEHSLSTFAIATTLGVLAAVQIFVQSIFFLHVSVAPQKRVDLISYGFSLFVAIVFVFGTLFVMHNAAVHMMSR